MSPYVKAFNLLLVGCFTRMWGILLGGESDCEELSGSYSQEMMGLVLVDIDINL